MKHTVITLILGLTSAASVLAAGSATPQPPPAALMDAACDPIQPFALPYKVERGDTTLGSGEIRLSPAAADGCFTLTQTATPNFLLRLISGPAVQTSEFCSQPDGSLRSYRYEQHRTGVGSDGENYHLDFHWGDRTVHGGRFDSMPVTDGQTDPLLLQLRVRQWMCKGTHAADESLTMPFIDKHGADQYVFAITHEEQITVPAGTFDAVLVERIDAEDRKSRFWLDPANQYQLLKAEQQKRDDPVIRLSLVKPR